MENKSAHHLACVSVRSIVHYEVHCLESGVNKIISKHWNHQNFAAQYIHLITDLSLTDGRKGFFFFLSFKRDFVYYFICFYFMSNMHARGKFHKYHRINSCWNKKKQKYPNNYFLFIIFIFVLPGCRLSMFFFKKKCKEYFTAQKLQWICPIPFSNAVNKSI